MNITSNMIEFSERIGQQSITYGSRLPKRCNHYNKDVMKMVRSVKRPSSTATREKWDAYWAEINSINEAYTIMRYRRLGIDIVDDLGDLFYEVTLPGGWQIKPDGDSVYWSNLIDENGKCVCSIFYKAAFYDRDAFVNFMEE